MKSIFSMVGIVAFACILFLIFFSYQFGAPKRDAGAEQFVVPVGTTRTDIIQNLYEKGFVKHVWTLRLAFTLKHPIGIVQPGGYDVSRAMNAWAIADILAGNPSSVWLTVPEGLRKEQTADIVAHALGWDVARTTAWISTDTAWSPDYTEGVYFPDTYLMPIRATGAEIAERFINTFNEKFKPYAAEFQRENVKWTTAIKVASLVQRESADSNDMPLIAGIIWNRLLVGMPLQIDATLQYARGRTADGWWSPITPADKKLDSPYNTYMHKGLPPHPIASPGLDAIDAVLHPATTKCLYYLHDSDRMIHCAVTYEEHKVNIQKYLKQ